MDAGSKLKLHRITAAQVNWQEIDDAFGQLDETMRKVKPGTTLDGESLLSTEDRALARRAFEVATEEFNKTIGWMRPMMWLVVGSIVFAFAIAVAGGALLRFTPWATLMPIASISSLFGLLPLAYALAKDQAMLQLIPARYALAIELCHTKQDMKKLSDRFLKETEISRRKLR
jgi:hypothetical protein